MVTKKIAPKTKRYLAALSALAVCIAAVGVLRRSGLEELTDKNLVNALHSLYPTQEGSLHVRRPAVLNTHSPIALRKGVLYKAKVDENTGTLTLMATNVFDRQTKTVYTQKVQDGNRYGFQFSGSDLFVEKYPGLPTHSSLSSVPPRPVPPKPISIQQVGELTRKVFVEKRNRNKQVTHVALHGMEPATLQGDYT